MLGELVQLGAVSDSVSCNTHPGSSGVHEIVAFPGPAGAMLRYGALGVCTAIAQNPLARANVPPLIGDRKSHV